MSTGAQAGWWRALPIAALVVSVLAVPGVIRLAVDTEIVDILPADSPAVEDFRVFLDDFGGLERVFVVVSADQEGVEGGRRTLSQQAACALADELQASDAFHDARCGIEPADEELLARAVLQRALLLLDEAALASVEERLGPEALARRAAEIRRRLRSPVSALEKRWLRHDPLGFASSLDLLAGAGGAAPPVDPWTGAFSAPGSHLGLVIATPTASALDAVRGREVAAVIEGAREAAARECDCAVSLASLGGPLYAAQDEAALRSDLRRTLTTSALGCAVVLAAAFGGVGLPLAILAAVGLALLWTASALGWLSGSITGVGLGFAAVLVGLGTDFGIHGAVRHLQGGEATTPASLYREVGRGIAASAATTAAAFSVLVLASFRPLRDVGLGVAIGMIAMLASTAAMAPLLGWRGLGSRLHPTPAWRFLGGVAQRIAGGASGRPRAAAVLLLAVTAPALWGAWNLELDADPSALRSTDHPALEAEELLAGAFGVAPVELRVVVRAPDLETALERSAEVEERLSRSGSEELWVEGPHRWLPPRDRIAARLERLAGLNLGQVVDRLVGELSAAGLDPRAFAPGLRALEELGRGRDPLGSDPLAAVPGGLPGGLVRRDAGYSSLLSVRAAGSVEPADVEGIVERIASIPGTAVVSAGRVGVELRRVAVGDLRRLGLVALALVFGVVLASFRGDLARTLLSLLPVTVGCLWTLGLWGAFSGRLDLLSVALLPVLLGVGIDDGLHTVHAAAAQGDARLRRALAEVGRALVLTTATTAVGFGSLVTSSIPGLRHAGQIVALGVICCLLATLVVLPVAEELAGGRSRSRR